MNSQMLNGAQSQSVQVNPVEVARFALVFLSRATFNASERQAFDLAEGLLRAIVDGRVALSTPASEVTQPLPTANASDADAPTVQ